LEKHLRFAPEGNSSLLASYEAEREADHRAHDHDDTG
jgi:hypothetical protein